MQTKEANCVSQGSEVTFFQVWIVEKYITTQSYVKKFFRIMFLPDLLKNKTFAFQKYIEHFPNCYDTPFLKFKIAALRFCGKYKSTFHRIRYAD